MAEVAVSSSISKRFGAVTAVDDLSWRFDDGRLTVLVGPSGCGKTTLLRMIAGLEEASGGQVLFAGKAVTTVPPWERNAAMVFQSYALYPHMTVFANMAVPLTGPQAEEGRYPPAGGAHGPVAGHRSPARSASRRSCPAARCSASPWAGPWCASRKST